MRTLPPDAAPLASTSASPTKPTWGATRSMRPPLLPSALPTARVRLPASRMSVSLACSTISPFAPTLRLWASARPRWLTMPA